MRKRSKANGRRQAAGKPVAAHAAKKEPSAMDMLHDAAARTDYAESRRKDFTLKPRAVRKYERFSSMGGES